MIKAVIFDMDGVIFDSERVICDLWLEIAKENDIPGIEELMLKCIGLNDKATDDLFTNTYGDRFPYAEFKKQISVEYHSRYDGGRLPMKPGVKELLSFLKANNVKTALASSTRVETVKNQLRDADILKYFDVVVGGDMVKNSKPNPEIFLKAAEKLGIDPKEAYIIEDSFNGIKAAHAANAFPVMVPDMLEPNEEISALCHRIFKDLLEVKDYFEGLV